MKNKIKTQIEELERGCGKEVPAGKDRVHGYPLHNTCGLTLMGETYLCKDCKAKQLNNQTKPQIIEERKEQLERGCCKFFGDLICRKKHLCPLCQAELKGIRSTEEMYQKKDGIKEILKEVEKLITNFEKGLRGDGFTFKKGVDGYTLRGEPTIKRLEILKTKLEELKRRTKWIDKR